MPTHVDGFDLAKLLKKVGEVLLCGLLVHLAHPQRGATDCKEININTDKPKDIKMITDFGFLERVIRFNGAILVYVITSHDRQHVPRPYR